MTEFVCAGCGETFDGLSTPEELEAERAAFADMPDDELEIICDDCWRGMRKRFPTLDARLRLEGL